MMQLYAFAVVLLAGTQWVEAASPPQKIYGQACSYTIANPLPRQPNFVCQKLGSLPNMFPNAITRLTKTGEDGETECRQACLAHPFRCESYSYDTVAAVCKYSPKTLRQQGWATGDRTQPWRHSNYRCYQSSCAADPDALQNCLFTGKINTLLGYHNVPKYEGQYWQAVEQAIGDTETTSVVLVPTTSQADATVFSLGGPDQGGDTLKNFGLFTIRQDNVSDVIVPREYFVNIDRTVYNSGDSQRLVLRHRIPAGDESDSEDDSTFAELACSSQDDPVNPASIRCTLPPTDLISSITTRGDQVYLFICDNGTGVIEAGKTIPDGCWPLNIPAFPQQVVAGLGVGCDVGSGDIDK